MALSAGSVPEGMADRTAECPHCFRGTVYEPTEDTLHDEASECPMCFGTGRRTERTERLRIRAERKAAERQADTLDAQHSGLERL
jgi:hypothetical protein